MQELASTCQAYGDSIHDPRIHGRAHLRGHALELDVASCGTTKERALKNLKAAVRLLLEEAEKMGTLRQILEEAGYTRRKSSIASPKFISVQRVNLPLPLTNAKA